MILIIYIYLNNNFTFKFIIYQILIISSTNINNEIYIFSKGRAKVAKINRDK